MITIKRKNTGQDLINNIKILNSYDEVECRKIQKKKTGIVSFTSQYFKKKTCSGISTSSSNIILK